MTAGSRYSAVRALIARALPSSAAGRAAFGALLLLGIFLRTAALTWGIPPRDNAPSFYHDEGHVLSHIEQPWGAFRQHFDWYELIRPVFLFRMIGRPLILLGRALGWDDGGTRIFELVVLRTIPAAFSIAALVAVYAVGRALGGVRTGLWALALLAVMPGHWYYAQILKGDILVATFFAIALLVTYRLAERGDWAAYLATGTLLGFGAAQKPTMLVAAPLFLLAHILNSARRRSVTALVSPRAWAALAVSIVVFFAFYPYPYINPAQFRTEAKRELLGSSSQLLSFRSDFRPQTYVRLWNAYNSAERPFLDMIFGRFLRASLVPAAAAAAVFALVRVVRWRDSRLLLLVIFAALFLHSLSFGPAFDDRYVVPAAPFVVLFAALAAAGAYLPRPPPKAVRVLGAVLGGVLFMGTAAISWQTFPTFAFSDPREEAVQWVMGEAGRGTVVAQPTLTGRWALVFDRSRVTPVPLIAGGDTDRRVLRLAEAPFVVVQREPWHYDHTFRYEQEGARPAFGQFLGGAYERVRTFGHEPALFGMKLPRNLGTPVIDVYRRVRDPATTTVSTLTPSGAARVLPVVHGTTLRLLGPTFSEADLRTRFVQVTADLRGVSAAWRAGTEPLRIGLLALWDDSPPPTEFRDLPDESTFLTKEGYWGWLVRLRPADVRGDRLTLALDHSRAGLWDFYGGWNGVLEPAPGNPKDVSRVRFALVVLGPEGGAGTVEVLEASVDQYAAP